ncbi:uncharacterized protein F5891DRAFT_390819 [Suillus fuscotomentosus]|uniref:Ricin B lectin domain-containing protein n=1 Tax=Suillus fuscotomentosus TaxID=1912939 RepID=A0AAD4E5D8_9AGAM|nr:uncharacterized protein F5891DRAFT_390819 [Suillus fuscotomentosus]KAG1899657.1 hypothetical protein F5891DRAFT_390819 [Suillus fuscotomentosus]
MARVKNQHTYTLRNCKGGTAMHLSGDDNYSISGFRPYDGSNQAWIFQQRDCDQNGWFIKSSRSGKYLGIEGNPKNGALVVVVSKPFKWDVKDSNVNGAKGVRILVYGTNFSLDLDYGKSANHTKIILWESGNNANQIWAPTERVSIKDQHTYSLKNCRRGTAVDLSGNDSYSIIGFTPYDGPNQGVIYHSVADRLCVD